MFAEQSVTINGQSLNYARTGPQSDGIPLLFLHGVSRRWQSFLPLLPQLGSRYEIFALDQRGHGRSGLGKRYDVLDYIQDAVGFVNQVVERPTLIYGHSLGAMVAAGTAAQIPDLVAGIIMEDPPFRAMGERIAQGPLKSLMAGMQMYAGDPRTVAEIAKDFADVELYDPRTDQHTRMGNIRDGVSLRFSARSLQDVDPQVFACIVAGAWLKGFEMEKICAAIRCPALLFQADERAGGMLADDDVALLKRHVPSLIHLSFSGVPHLMHWAITERILNHTWGFIESLDTNTPSSTNRELKG